VRTRSFRFAPLGDCRREFELRSGTANIEWEAEEGERADVAGQINHDADRPAKLQTAPDAPTLAPDSETDRELSSNGAAGQGSGNGGDPPAPPAPDQEPAQDELDGQWEPVEEEPEDVEWEPIEGEPDDVEWDSRDDEADDA
jgi:hypothetical protein